MKVAMTVLVETTPERWAEVYGGAGNPGQVRADVRSYLDALVRGCAASEEDAWTVASVTVRPPRSSPLGPRS